MDDKEKESVIVECATIAIVFGFLAAVATELWLRQLGKRKENENGRKNGRD